MKNKINNKNLASILTLTIVLLMCFFAGLYFLYSNNQTTNNSTNNVVFADEVGWTVEHYKQKLSFSEVFDVADYELFESETFDAEAGSTQTVVAKDYEGFELNTDESVLEAFIEEDGSTVLRLYYDRLKFQIDAFADEGITSIKINNLNTTSKMFLFGESISITCTFRAHKVFSHYEAYETGNEENIFEINSDQFLMPAFNLTVNLKSEIEKFRIVINKVFYENKEDFQVQTFSTLSIPYNSSGSIEIPANTSYHLFQVDGKYYSATNDNISFDGTTLSIESAVSDDEIFIYYEKDYYQIVLSYGTNYTINNFNGGVVTLEDSEYIFEKEIVDKVCIANVYLGNDISINYSAKSSYRFYEVIVTDENDYAEGFDSIKIEDDVILIRNVSNKIFIKVIFMRTYDITGKIQSLQIGSQQKKVAQIAFDMETFKYDDISKTIDEGFSVVLDVAVDEEYARVYEFKKWIITYDNGAEIDYDEYLITYYENSAKIQIEEIYNNLTFTAVFGKKILGVQIAWNGLFGTVETETEGADDIYYVEFGDNISFVLKPIDNMHFLKVLEMKAIQVQLEGENVFVILLDEREDETLVENETLTNANQTVYNDSSGVDDETDELENAVKQTIFSISNITENLTVNVKFVSDTWWEHVTDHGLFGNGTEEYPYAIRHAEDLALVSYYVNNNVQANATTIDYDKARYILLADIDCGHDYFYVPIGTDASPFNGIFDYNYFHIENMYIENENLDYLYDGVFYKIGPEGKVINRFRNYTLLLVTLVIVLIIALATILIVIVNEKRLVKGPKRMLTIKEYMARKKNGDFSNFKPFMVGSQNAADTGQEEEPVNSSDKNDNDSNNNETAKTEE